MALWVENIQHATELQHHASAAYLSAVTAIQYRILDDRVSSNRYLDQAKIYAGKTTDYEARGYVHYTCSAISMMLLRTWPTE